MFDLLKRSDVSGKDFPNLHINISTDLVHQIFSFHNVVCHRFNALYVPLLFFLISDLVRQRWNKSRHILLLVLVPKFSSFTEFVFDLIHNSSWNVFLFEVLLDDIQISIFVCFLEVLIYFFVAHIWYIKKAILLFLFYFFSLCCLLLFSIYLTDQGIKIHSRIV
jgi:hypothetical protein